MRRGPVIIAGILLVVLTGLGIWRYVARPGEGAQVPLPGRPSCPEVISLERPEHRAELVCLAKARARATQVAARLGCTLEKLPHLVAGDRLVVEPGTPDCKTTVARMSGSSLLALGLPVDLNRATVDDLEALPGIGPTKAEAIVEDRLAHGRFHSIADLARVKGIGPATVRRLAGKISVEP